MLVFVQVTKLLCSESEAELALLHRHTAHATIPICRGSQHALHGADDIYSQLQEALLAEPGRLHFHSACDSGDGSSGQHRCRENQNALAGFLATLHTIPCL